MAASVLTASALSDVDGDILEIIGMKPSPESDENPDGGFTEDDRQYAGELYTALPDYLRSKYAKARRVQNSRLG